MMIQASTRDGVNNAYKCFLFVQPHKLINIKSVM